MRQRNGLITVRKARIGWWVDGSWCPTMRIRDHWIRRQRERKPDAVVRTPG